MGDRHVLLTDPLHQQATAKERQPGITVGHEDLRTVKTAISTAPGGLRHVKDPDRSVTNLLAEYT
jgi:hypothetical protein